MHYEQSEVVLDAGKPPAQPSVQEVPDNTPKCRLTEELQWARIDMYIRLLGGKI